MGLVRAMHFAVRLDYAPLISSSVAESTPAATRKINTMHRRTLGTAVLAASTLSFPRIATAQADWPARPIRLVIPYPPAGGTDVISREMASRIGSMNAWNIVPENRSGAGGNIGIDIVAKAPPDGHTIAMGQCANLAINVTLYPNIPYDPLRDLTFVSLVAVQPSVIVVPRASPHRTIGEYLAFAKANPTRLTVGHSGSGTVGHLSSEILDIRAEVRTTIVPYRGAAQVVTDMLAGRVDGFHANPLAVRGFLDSGELRPIAVTSPGRMGLLPNVPTVAESGYPGFEAMNWTGLVAPAGTPAPVVARLNGATRAALARPEVIARLAAEGSEPNPSSPEAFRAFCASEIEKWGKVVRDARVRAD